MTWQSTPAVLVLFVAGLAALSWAVYGFASRRPHGDAHVTVLSLLCLAVAGWAFGYGVQLSATDFRTQLAVYKLLHVAAAFVAPLWFLFGVAYEGRSGLPSRRRVALLCVVPVVLLLALPTNPGSLVLTAASQQSVGGLVTLVTDSGPLYQLFLAYSYVLLLVGCGLVGRHALRSAPHVRGQATLVLAAALVPFAVSVLDTFDVPPVGTLPINLTPVSLSLSVVVFGLAVFRNRLFDPTPVARTTVFETMREGVVVVAADGRVVDVNPAARTLLDLPDDVVGRQASSVVPGVESGDGASVDAELVVCPEDGSGERHTLQVTRSPLDPDGTAGGSVLLYHDVTEREAHRRLLERRNDRLDTFTTTISHDLRNPLSVISGYVALTRDTGNLDHLDTVDRTVTRIADFLDDLLTLARQGRTIGDPVRVSLAALVDETVAAAETELTVEATTDRDLLADPDRLRQVFENLLHNAADHGGATTVRVGDLPDGFFVEDDGTGISAEKRETVFDYGYTTSAGGSGFGLVIVREIVEAHGWEIAVTEGSTGGARFEVTGVDSMTPIAASLSTEPPRTEPSQASAEESGVDD
ncbi:PAS fold-containing protein [Halogranum gelatinilyticum]|uniref:histidine kinase n=1 Tax=Halogranum gelatinilyticum TaxID=660521 RepID=A0A1G9TXQ1_9EURY|nr:histidine kinase N-terminal 7TM domain-containing protein [Halogranum gelatinilyticum]SDM52403.1 PAS fold-containing protein [Halogranum gelatinilyticum]